MEFAILILSLIGLIFFGTIFMNVKPQSDEMWSKVRLSTNGTHRDGWCRVIPGAGVMYYGIDGNPIINENVKILRSYDTDEAPPIVELDSEEPAFTFYIDCEYKSDPNSSVSIFS